MTRLHALLMVLFAPHFLVYTRRGSVSWMHHKEMGLGDTMKVIEGAGEIEEDLIQMDENDIFVHSLISGE